MTSTSRNKIVREKKNRLFYFNDYSKNYKEITKKSGIDRNTRVDACGICRRWCGNGVCEEET